MPVPVPELRGWVGLEQAEAELLALQYRWEAAPEPEPPPDTPSHCTDGLRGEDRDPPPLPQGDLGQLTNKANGGSKSSFCRLSPLAVAYGFELFSWNPNQNHGQSPINSQDMLFHRQVVPGPKLWDGIP